MTPKLLAVSKSKILVVDDHGVFRDGLVRLINHEKDLVVCGEAADAPQALKLLQSVKPDVVIIDISLEGMNGIDLTRNIRARLPQVLILVLSMYKESLYAERALRAGANGYIMKRESGRALLSAVRHVLHGHTYVSEDLNRTILNGLVNSRDDFKFSPIERLSDRELEIFQLIGQGYGTKQIADELHISMKTVETHREHIRDKVNLKNTFELVQSAIQWVNQR
jgi:DNA-binding NarL/FixJ family response regulator